MRIAHLQAMGTHTAGARMLWPALQGTRGRRSACHQLARCSSGGPLLKRYAVVGGGFAGVAVAYNLLRLASPSRPVQVELWEAHGLGAGGSGAAAGMLEPYTPRGKLLWRGLEAFRDALALVAAAEAEADASQGPVAWRRGILRPARTQKQVDDFQQFVPREGEEAAATGGVVLGASEMAALVPGLQPERLMEAAATAEAAGAEGAAAGPGTGLLARHALALHPLRYLAALWRGCERLAAGAGAGSSARLVLSRVASLRDLDTEHGPYSGIVVAAGGAAGALPETAGLLPVELCKGLTLELQSGACGMLGRENERGAPAAGGLDCSRGPTEEGPEEREEVGAAGVGRATPPSLLGHTYLAFHGSQRAVVGATYEYGISAEEAYALCGEGAAPAAAVAAAAAALLPPARELWPPLGGWEVVGGRAGVRAQPTNALEGAVPYAGKLEGRESWWVLGGLGSRGLVYHAYLGRLVAEAAAAGSEEGLPAQLLRWRGAPPVRARVL